MMNLDEPNHSRLRSLVHKAFTPSSIETFRQNIEQVVDATLDNIDSRQFDLVAEFSKPVPTIVIADYIGVDSSDHEQFKAWTDSLLLQGYPMPTEAQWDEIVNADTALRNYMKAVVQDRRTSPQDDLITRLVKAEAESDTLNDNEVIDMCCLLIGAGNFTTTDLISNCAFQLLQLDTRDNLEFSRVVEETLRFDPPAMAVRRFVTEDIVVGEHRIEKGSVINLMTGAANHDPNHYPEAEEFQPHRDTRGHLAFGLGIHHCLGAPLARLEASIAIAKLFDRFPALSLKSSKRSRRMDFRGFTSLVVQSTA